MRLIDVDEMIEYLHTEDPRFKELVDQIIKMIDIQTEITPEDAVWDIVADEIYERLENYYSKYCDDVNDPRWMGFMECMCYIPCVLKKIRRV